MANRWGARAALICLVALAAVAPLAAQENLADQVREMEAAGNARGAAALLEQAVGRDATIENLTAFAEFLDRHGDDRARTYYGRLLDRIDPEARERRAEVTRRLTLLSMLAGDSAAARRHLEEYRTAGGSGIEGPVPDPAEKTPAAHYIEVPGPPESFARMAAFSHFLEPDDILPALGRNVITSGYRVTASYEGLQPTEYMKLIGRYLSQARELEKLAGESREIRIEQCDSPQTAELLRVLGYRMRGGCGSEVILETVNATRAFLTIDSGFPLAELELALRTNRLFSYDYKPTRLPLLYGEDYWLSDKEKKQHAAFIDAFLADPALCRLYLALSKLDHATAEELRKRQSLEFLKAFAHVLDFFGGLFELRDGKAVIPGGERAKATWTQLAGASPDNGGEFYEKLIATDDGWLASYYDSLRRIDGPVLEYLTEPKRLERFYMAIRGKVTSPGPARPVFRSNADLMLLTSRLRLEPDGQAHIPGGVELWSRLFATNPHKVYDEKLRKLAKSWKEPDDVLEAVFALCRKPVDNEPLKIFMALTDINRRRATSLQPATVEQIARAWFDYGDQFPAFAETGSLREETILAYLESARLIDKIGDRLARSDAAGSFQALVGLWQIGIRNRLIPEDRADESLSAILAQFQKFENRRTAFDQVRQATERLIADVGGTQGKSAQDVFLSIAAGSTQPADMETHEALVNQARGIFDRQRLVSLDVIFEVADHLEALAGGGELNTAIVNRLDSRIQDLRDFREGLSSVEKNAVSFGYWSERHLQAQRKIDLRNDVRKAMGSPERLRGLRGDLVAILRDTLVGYNYIHYAPPGAQLLQTNPLFVRSHDFIGTAGTNETWQETEVYGTGWPSSAGGRLVGSLAGLPYALAQAEQNFLIPHTEQALIWTDLVPQMVVTAKVPRWWNVSPQLMHWVALHVRVATSTVAAATMDRSRRELTLNTLTHQATPARVGEVAALLERGDVAAALDHITPSELFLIGEAATRQGDWESALTREIKRLSAAHPDRINAVEVSRAFGSPKPKLASSYRPELLHLRTFPTLMGYSSRIMAESWESNLIFFATLADDLYLRPTQLNEAVPEWTKRTVETIFATHLEDWPAVLRSLRQVGDGVRAEAREPAGGIERASLK